MSGGGICAPADQMARAEAERRRANQEEQERMALSREGIPVTSPLYQGIRLAGQEAGARSIDRMAAGQAERGQQAQQWGLGQQLGLVSRRAEIESGLGQREAEYRGKPWQGLAQTFPQLGGLYTQYRTGKRAQRQTEEAMAR